MKSPGGRLLTGLTLDRTSSTPLYRQLYLQIRQQILAGRLQGGTRMPSTRTLCKEQGLSRITILNAFDLLIAESFLVYKDFRNCLIIVSCIYPHLFAQGLNNIRHNHPKQKHYWLQTTKLLLHCQT